MVGEVRGLSMLLRQVAKSTQVEGQIFISLFLSSLVRLWKCPSAKAVCQAGWVLGGLTARGQSARRAVMAWCFQPSWELRAWLVECASPAC